MSTDLTRKLLDSYKSKRDSFVEFPIADTAQLWAYRQVAAVLHCFYPEKLNPGPDIPISKNPRTLLYDDISYTPGRFSEGLFTLKMNVRKDALKRFGSREEMLKVIENNQHRILTSLQKMWENYLRDGKLPEPKTLSFSELTDFSQIVSWLDGIDGSIPDASFVEQLLRQKSILANFEHLVTNNFTGRETELALLKRHLNPTSENAGKKNIADLITNWLSASDPLPILSIYGPGGIGKSALSGKMLSDNVQADKNVQLPFAYLPFDQGSLRIESPFTILVAAASQFGLQFPEYEERINAFNDNVRRFRDNRSSLINRRISNMSRAITLEEYHKEDDFLYTEFANLLKAISEDKNRTLGKGTKVLLVFDTFEEVEYRDFESLNGFWQMLSRLIELCPALRIIISGRSSVAKLGVSSELLTELPLEQLKLPDRSLLLQRLGVDKEVADTVAQQVGGNPLSLHLAANLITSDKSEADSKGIKNLSTRKWLLFQVDEQIIQGQLYKRILAHIHDENVRKLAHPGMVLRTVTPEVILRVLGPECNIPLNDIQEADGLFQELKKEQALVQVSYNGDLVYRPEIRQAMIRLLLQDKFNEVRKLRRAAIEYYSTKDDESSRAEEMYHRLALGEDDFPILDQRWQTGIETSIASNLEEYSDRIKVWLASRINLEIPREIFQRADIADWERNITRKVKKALADYQPVRALELLGERDQRSDTSPLYALEAKTQMLLENLELANAVIDKGIESISNSTNRGRLAELFWLGSQVKLMNQLVKEADDALKQAGEVIVNASNPLPRMHILCHRLLIRNHYSQVFTETSAELRISLNNVCGCVDESNALHMGFVLSLALSLLSGEFPKTVDRLSKFTLPEYSVSPDMLTSENLQGLEEYREAWEEEEDTSIKSFV